MRIGLFVWLIAWSTSAWGEQPAPSETKRTVSILSLPSFLHPPSSLDPDEPRLEYANIGGRWEAMAGNQVVLYGRPSSRLSFGVSLAGFIQLINYNTHDPVPWQTFRANIGLNSIWEVHAQRLRRARLLLQLGFFHESDHAASGGYAGRYLDYPWSLGFDNAGFSSYEYFKLKATYLRPLGTRWELAASLGLRAFTPPISPTGGRGLLLAPQAEARGSLRVAGSFWVYLGAFFEGIVNKFVAERWGFRSQMDHDVLIYQFVELGLDWRAGSSTRLEPFFSYRYANGRGLDFIERRSEFGGGVRFWL